MGNRLIVGLDLGTSGLKAVAINDAGEIVARASSKYPTARPELGASEQNPSDWISSVKEIVAQIKNSTGDQEWKAIGLSGMLPTLVTVDGEGVPVGAAITWEDGRAEAEGDALRNGIGADDIYKITGQWVDGRYLLPMLARLCKVDPERIARSTRLLGAKDYLFFYLTGKYLTDPSTATGFGCFDIHTGEWDFEIIAKHLTTSKLLELPEIASSRTTSAITARAADALGLQGDIAVCVGAADSVLGAIGMGVDSPGDIAYVGGTSTIILGISNTPIHDVQHRYLITPMVDSDSWGLEMDLLSTGSAIRWLANLLNIKDEESLIALAISADDSRLPTFLPYLAPGEQGALWDPTLTGTLTGLDVGHTSAEIARSLIDGILVESARCIQTLHEIGLHNGSIRVSGGSASDPWFRQQLANAVQRTIEANISQEPDRSALGAAIVAAQSIGLNISHALMKLESTFPHDGSDAYWIQRKNINDTERMKWKK